MFTRTARLFLRPPFPEDWRAIHSAVCDEKVVRMLAGPPWPYGDEDAKAFAQRQPEELFPRFLVTHPQEEGAVIGTAGLREAREGAELGFWITRRHWGRGYATEAARAVVEIGRMLGHKHIVAGRFLDNPASARVLAKLGFRPVEEVRPQFCAGRGGELVLARRYALDFDAAPELAGESKVTTA